MNGLKKLALVVIGSIIVGLGVSVATISGFGADPITVLWDGITNIIPVTMGQASMILALLMLCIVVFIDRKQINVGTIVNPFVVGLATDFFAKYVIEVNNIVMKVILLLVGLILIAFGLALYSYANFGRGAYEGLVFSLEKKLNIKFSYIRTGFDLAFLILGVVLGGKLSIGPIIAFIILGSIIGKFINVFDNIKFLKAINEA